MPQTLKQQLQWIADMAPELLPNQVVSLLREMVPYDEDLESYDFDAFDETLIPNLIDKLRRINNLTAPIVNAWHLNLKVILGLGDVLHQIPLAGDCELGMFLVDVENFLASEFKRNKHDHQGPFFAAKNQSHLYSLTQLAVWLAQQKAEGRTNWIQYLMPGVTPPPPQDRAERLESINFDDAILVQDKYLVTWENIYTSTLNYMRANEAIKELRVCYSTTKTVQEQVGAEIIDKQVIEYIDLSPTELAALYKKIPSAKTCCDNFTNYLTETAALSTNKDFLSHMQAMLVASSRSGNETLPEEIRKLSTVEINQWKEKNATEAADFVQLWLNKWLHILREAQPENYETLVNNEKFNALMARIKLQEHTSKEINLRTVNTENCTQITSGKFKDFIKTVNAKSDHPLHAFFNSDLVGRDVMLEEMKQNPKYLKSEQQLDDADKLFTQHQQELAKVNTRIEVLAKFAMIQTDPVAESIFLMAPFREAYLFFTDSSKNIFLPAYQYTLATNLPNVLLISKIQQRWLQDKLEPCKHIKTLSSFLKKIQGMIPDLIEQDGKIIDKGRSIQLVTLSDTNSFKIIKSPIPEVICRHLRDIIAEFETNGPISNVKNSGRRDRLETKYTTLEKACGKLINIHHEILRSVNLENIVNNQQDPACKFVLDLFHTTFKLHTPPENFLSMVASLDIHLIEKVLKPLAIFLDEVYLPTIEYSRTVGDAEFMQASFVKRLQNIITNLNVNAPESETITESLSSTAARINYAATLWQFLQLENIDLLLPQGVSKQQILGEMYSSDEIYANGDLLMQSIGKILPEPEKLFAAKFNPQQHPSSAAALLCIQKYLIALNAEVLAAVEPDRTQLLNKFIELSTALDNEIDALKHTNVKTLGREALFKKIIVGICPHIPQTESYLWLNMLPFLNEHEKNILQAKTTLQNLTATRRKLEQYQDKPFTALEKTSEGFAKAADENLAAVAIERLDKMIAKISTPIAALAIQEAKLNGLVTQTSQLQDEIDKLESDNRKLNVQKTAAQAKNNAAAVATLEIQIANKKHSIKNKKLELNHLKFTIQKLNTEIAQLEKQTNYTGCAELAFISECLEKSYAAIDGQVIDTILDNQHAPVCNIFLQDLYNLLQPIKYIKVFDLAPIKTLLPQAKKLANKNFISNLRLLTNNIALHYVPVIKSLKPEHPLWSNFRLTSLAAAYASSNAKLTAQDDTAFATKLGDTAAWIKYAKIFYDLCDLKTNKGISTFKKIKINTQLWLENKDDRRDASLTKIGLLKKINNLFGADTLVIQDDFSIEKNPATTTALLVYEYCIKQEDITKPTPIAIAKGPDRQKLADLFATKAYATQTREELFADVLDVIYPLIAKRRYYEIINYKHLLPNMNAKEKMLLHVKMQITRLEYKQKHLGMFEDQFLTDAKLGRLKTFYAQLQTASADKVDTLQEPLLQIYRQSRSKAGVESDYTTTAASFRRMLKANR